MTYVSSGYEQFHGIDRLVATRAAIILWTRLAVMPVEILFEAIEAELEQRGVKL
ncbi:hypothetical protein ABID59_000018 [Bradyrhizobium sp. S3.3.6]|uniref:hypothetical protein n=1 Tax=Bradyrhizobium sp. S3.3.6 TaxID=3156429 RepID=UPI00339B2070